jgi:hypothetical protein
MGDIHTEAYNKLKEAVGNSTQLFFLIFGIGGVQLQIVDKVEQPILFISKTFSDVASRWPTIEQEAYAIFYCVTSLESYLLGQFFYVETDHRNLVYIDVATSPKLIRWKLRLQEYNFEIIHIPGKRNVIADTLSRCYGTKLSLKRYSHNDCIPESFQNIMLTGENVSISTIQTNLLDKKILRIVRIWKIFSAVMNQSLIL